MAVWCVLLIPSEIAAFRSKQKLYGVELLSKDIQAEIIDLLKNKVIERIIRQTHNFVIGYHRKVRDRIKL